MDDELLEKLADIEGYEDAMDMLSDASVDSVVPGICLECKQYTCEVEPDSSEGWCEACGTNTVQSCLVMAGII